MGMVVTDIMAQQVNKLGYRLVGKSFVCFSNLGGLIDTKHEIFYPTSMCTYYDNTICVMGHDTNNNIKVLPFSIFIKEYSKI